MSRKFCLYLDESGDFIKDIEKVKKKKFSPSLISGIMMESGTVGKGEINRLLPEEEYHCSEANISKGKEDQFQHFMKIAENDKIKIVLFKNEECIWVLDDFVTYQNIMGSGIIQLLKKLKSMYGDVQLDVLLANRVDNRRNISAVSIDEYIYHLKEHLIIKGLEEDFIEGKDWTLTNMPCKRDKRLMLADIVCNTFLQKDTGMKTFNPEYSETINKIYNDPDKTFKFSVFEDSVTSTFTQYMAQNRIGEAVICLMQCNNTDILTSHSKILEERLKQENISEVTLQCQYIMNHIDFLNHSKVRDEQILCMIQNMVNYFLPILNRHSSQEIQSMVAKIRMDLKFQELTIYTHQGDTTRAHIAIKECNTLLLKLPKTLENIDYKFNYRNRIIIQDINEFNYESALKKYHELRQDCKDMKDAMILIEDSEIKYETYGKVLGTGVQIQTVLTRMNPAIYENGIQDSEDAIQEFSIPAERNRQYLYRVQLETEGNQFDLAWKYLLKAAGISDESGTLDDMIKEVGKDNIYLFMNYIRLMAEGSLKGWKQSEAMYNRINSKGLIKEYIFGKEKNYHPFEIITWKLGTYLANTGVMDAASENYQRCYDICTKENEDYTLWIIGMAALLEWLSYSLKNKEKRTKAIIKKLEGLQKKIRQADVPEIMKQFYVNLDLKNENWEYFFQLSRKVVY